MKIKKVLSLVFVLLAVLLITSCKTKKYEVTFLDYNDHVIEVVKVKKGGTVTAPEVEAREGYTFVGWDKELTNVTKHLEVKALYEINNYTVTFVGYDGETLAKESVEYGKAATAPDAPLIEGKTFIEWNKDFTNIKEDITITAVYGDTTFTVKFVDHDDKQIGDVQVLKYKEDATPPEGPNTLEGYHFVGWDTYYKNVTKNLVIKARYNINEYNVTFVGHDGEALKRETVEHGEDATAPDTPLVEGKEFIEWNKDFTNVKEDLTVIAVYDDSEFTVKFVDHDDEQIGDVQLVKYKEDATPPEDPDTLEGYHFVGWDKDHKNVTDNLVIKAVYEINEYTVTFVGHDGEALKTETVEHGKAATAPDAPLVEGKEFLEWNKDFTNVKEDLTVIAVYDDSEFTVKFVDHDDEQIGDVQVVKYKEDATPPEDPVREGYTFVGWDLDHKNVTDNLVIKAVYQINEYTVTYMFNDEVYFVETVKYGDDATPPADPELEGFTFTGWDLDYDNVTEDLILTAQFEVKRFVVLFYDYDLSHITTKFVNYGEDAEAPEDPSREGYTFTGWSRDFTNIKSNTAVYAEYKIKTYVVKFVEGKTTIAIKVVEHGADAELPPDPEKEGYIFMGWDKDTTNVKSNLTVRPYYILKNYNVGFAGNGGSSVPPVVVDHGEKIPKPADPTRVGYVFDGWFTSFEFDTEWNFALDVVTSDLTLVAKWNAVDNLTVTFYIGETNETHTVDVPYNEKVEVYYRNKGGYAVNNWKLNGVDFNFNTNITEDITLTGSYHKLFEYSEIYGQPNNIILTKYIGNGLKHVIIPDMMDGKNVTEVANIFTNAVYDVTVIEKLTIGKNINKIYAGAVQGFHLLHGLKNFEVSELNENFGEQDGVLFGLSELGVMEHLIAYPAGKTDSSYKIHSTDVRIIGFYAFYKNEHLDELDFALARNLEIYESAFEDSSIFRVNNIVRIAIKTIDRKAFYKSQLEEFTIEPNVSYIGDNAFGAINDLVIYLKSEYSDVFHENWAGTATVISLIYTVTYMRDEEVVYLETIPYEEKAPNYYSPKQGHQFLGWYLENGSTLYDHNTPVTEDITLNGQWINDATYFNPNYEEQTIRNMHSDIIRVQIPTEILGTTMQILDINKTHEHGIEIIYIPETILEITENTIEFFSYLSSLEYIHVHKDNPNYKHIDGVLYEKNTGVLVFHPNKNCLMTKSYQVPNGTLVIGKGAFKNNTHLETVSFNLGLKKIEFEAFRNTRIVYFENTDKLTNLDEIVINAFKETIHFEKFYLLSSLTTLSRNAFDIDNDANIYIETAEKPAWGGLNFTYYIFHFVEFRGYNNYLLKKEAVQHGEDATPPVDKPNRYGYEFVGWDDYTNITSSRIISAKFEHYFKYYINERGAIITGYTGSNKYILAFPETIDNNNVVMIEDFDIPYALRDTLKVILIPKYVESFSVKHRQPLHKLEEIDLYPGNTYLTVVDNILYSSDMTELLFVPAKKTHIDKKFVIPETIIEIADYAFYTNYEIEEIHGGSNVEVIGKYAFTGMSLDYLSLSASTNNIKLVKEKAFEDCNYNGDFYLIYDNIDYVGEDAFMETFFTIYVIGVGGSPQSWHCDWMGNNFNIVYQP